MSSNNLVLNIMTQFLLILLDRNPMLHTGCSFGIVILHIFGYAGKGKFLTDQTNLIKPHSEMFPPIEEKNISNTIYYISH